MTIIRRFAALILFASPTAVLALGFADGVKIGEVSEHSVVLWARLTKDPEAGNRSDIWTAEKPNWTAPGKAGEISFMGRRWEITPRDIKQVTIVQQPGSFRVIAHPPTPQAPHWPDILAEYRL